MDYKELVNNIKILGLEESMIASGYPMSTDTKKLWEDSKSNNDVFDSNIKRANKLSSTAIGSGHDQFLTGIVVQFDLTFTVKAWTEMERYHFVDFVSSQSTMHRIAKMNLDEVYCEYVDSRIIEIMKDKVSKYNNESDPAIKKRRYLELLYSNPCGCKLTARMTTNYRQLKTIYQQRKDHRLPEWRAFCKWIETLPMKELILGGEESAKENN